LSRCTPSGAMGQAQAAEGLSSLLSGPEGARSISKVDDYYHVSKVRLGSGAFGTVWRGSCKRTGELRAIKVLAKPKDAAAKQRLLYEVQLLQKCESPNISQVYELLSDAKHDYVVLEYCSGGDFGDKLKERGRSITTDEVAHYVLQILRAVEYLHRPRVGICHRDIKPDNFLIRDTSAQPELVLADFGIAIPLKPGEKCTEVCGTPAYMAPEQTSVSPRYAHHVDVWACGVVLFELLHGRHPFVSPAGQFDREAARKGQVWHGGLSSVRDLRSAHQAATNLLQGRVAAVDDEAKKLCKRLMCPEPEHRITASGAMSHNFFRGRGGEEASPGQARAAEAPKQGARQVQRTDTRPEFAQKAEVPKQRSGGYGGRGRNSQQAYHPFPAAIPEAGMAPESDPFPAPKPEVDTSRRGSATVAGSEPASQAASVRAQSGCETGLPFAPSGLDFVSASLLPLGTSVNYWSESQGGWLRTEVSGHNQDGSMDLGVKLHADPKRIGPPVALPDAGVPAGPQWPAGTAVGYCSQTTSQVFDGVVASANSDGTYNLAQFQEQCLVMLKQGADPGRIVARSLVAGRAL